jgi:hypothetical protein
MDNLLGLRLTHPDAITFQTDNFDRNDEKIDVLVRFVANIPKEKD